MTEQQDRRKFLVDSLRIGGVVAAGAMGGFLAGRRSHAGEVRWQIDPDKCVACGKCATDCVLDESAVKCLQCFDMCGYCDVCTGYFDPNYRALDTAAENQLCPTDALIRKFVEGKAGQNFYEYTIEEDQCIGCGMCVKGCALMNGSLYLQVMQDRCVNCNECAIAIVCPSEAFVNVAVDKPYRLKRIAEQLIKAKSTTGNDAGAQELIKRVEPND